jgi:hypothetical protein
MNRGYLPWDGRPLPKVATALPKVGSELPLPWVDRDSRRRLTQVF